MTEQQMTEFDRWFEQRMDPELNLTPGDKELCRHAWQAALSHAEGEAQCEAHEPISTPHCPVCLLDERDELRGEVKRLLAEAEDRDNAAPQVAVPEPVGWVKWFDGEPSFQPRDALMPEDAKQHGWQLVGLMRSMPAPAPDEREIAALALERHADNLIVMAERDGRNSDRESQQTWEEAAYFAKQEAKRLRAGKEGE